MEWYNATLKLSEKVYLIIKKMISDNEIGVLLNRNPTISYGSIMYLKIVDVKHDINDVTMSLSSTILTLLAGDYDGDVLNLISIKDKDTREILKNVFSPVNLLIDSNN
jgi:methenyltetrahydromethanopterin cyclohydrolase